MLKKNEESRRKINKTYRKMKKQQEKKRKRTEEPKRPEVHGVKPFFPLGAGSVVTLAI